MSDIYPKFGNMLSGNISILLIFNHKMRRLIQLCFGEFPVFEILPISTPKESLKGESTVSVQLESL